MTMKGILRPGFIQLRVLDLDEAITHYCDRIGLDKVSREADGRVYLKGYDEFDRHSIILREADEPGMDMLGFKVLNEEALDHYCERLLRAGVEVTHVEPGEQPGLGRRISFISPSEHRFDLYADIEQSNNGPLIENPDLWRAEPRGMRPIRFDHCLLYGNDIEGSKSIFMEALDFSLTEIGYGEDGKSQVVFLSCSTKTHDIAFVQYPENGKFHHCAFYLEDWHDIGHAADLMTRYEIPIDIGPTRHGATRGQTIYFFDPSGNRNEVFSGGYTYYPDSPLRTWSNEKLGKNIFYYEQALNERFLTVVT
jgi:catechol 2,3-dioxygenase